MPLLRTRILNTILVTAPGAKVARSTVTNAYDFLDIEAGRVMVQDLFIGAYHNDIHIDHASDHVTLRNLIHSVFWDVAENVPVPSPIDNWVLANGTALSVGHADGIELSNFMVFIRSIGIMLTDSPDLSQNPRCGYGFGGNIDLDTVVYGIVVTASNTPGYKFTNVDIGGLGQTAVQVRGGGSMTPKIEINGGSQRGFWALGAYPPPAPVRDYHQHSAVMGCLLYCTAEPGRREAMADSCRLTQDSGSQSPLSWLGQVVRSV